MPGLNGEKIREYLGRKLTLPILFDIFSKNIPYSIELAKKEPGFAIRKCTNEAPISQSHETLNRKNILSSACPSRDSGYARLLVETYGEHSPARSPISHQSRPRNFRQRREKRLHSPE
jgi:hypothetical protein